MGAVRLDEFSWGVEPEGFVCEGAFVAAAAVDVGEPAGGVGARDVVDHGEVASRIYRGYGGDGAQRFRVRCRGGPLDEAGVGAAVGDDFSVAPWVFGQAVDQGVAIGGVVDEGDELAVGVASASAVDADEVEAARREVDAVGVVVVGAVRGHDEDRVGGLDAGGVAEAAEDGAVARGMSMRRGSNVVPGVYSSRW